MIKDKIIIASALVVATIILLVPYFTYNDNEACIETHLSLKKNETHILCGKEVKHGLD